MFDRSTRSFDFRPRSNGVTSSLNFNHFDQFIRKLEQENDCRTNFLFLFLFDSTKQSSTLRLMTVHTTVYIRRNSTIVFFFSIDQRSTNGNSFENRMSNKTNPIELFAKSKSNFVYRRSNELLFFSNRSIVGFNLTTSDKFTVESKNKTKRHF